MIQSTVYVPGFEVFFALGGRGLSLFLLGAAAKPSVRNPAFLSYFEC